MRNSRSYDTGKLLRGLRAFGVDSFRFRDIQHEGDTIKAKIYEGDEPKSFSYQDSSLAMNFHKIIAEDFREFWGHNLYFNIVAGEIIICWNTAIPTLAL